MRHNELKWLHLENSLKRNSVNYCDYDIVVILVKESVKPIIERTVTAIITIGIVFAIALMVLSFSLLIDAKRNQRIFSYYLEESLTNDSQLGPHTN